MRRRNYTPLLAILCVVLLFVVYKQFRHYRALAEELQTAQFRDELRRLQVGLACPPDVIVGDFRDWHALDEVRAQLRQRDGYPPTEYYSGVLMSVLARDVHYDAPVDVIRANATHEEIVNRVGNGGPDSAWLNRSIEAARETAGLFESPRPLGLYLSNNPKVFQKSLRPLLLRLLRAKSPTLSGAAARALYAAKDRSAEFHAALPRLMSPTDSFPSGWDVCYPCLALASFGDRSPGLREGLLLVVRDAYDPERSRALALLRECFPNTTLPSTTPATKP